MRPSERRELAVFRWLERAGPRQWQDVSIPELAKAISSHVAEVVEAFLGLRDRGAVQLRKWSDHAHDWVDYAGGQEGQFFYQGGFHAMITPSGRRYFEDLEQKARQEKDAEIHAEEAPLVFISCGQWSKEERDLGQKVKQLVEQMTGCRAYFAENQSSVEGLKEHIFRALGGAAGFIGIMHHRGRVSRPDGEHIRGSVWVEQEIGVTAFLTQMREQVDFPVAVYTERGIRREGVREQLLLHEVDFDAPDEVLVDLERRIKDGRFRLSRGPTGVDLRPTLGCHNLSPKPDSHDYELQVSIRNVGTEMAPNYEAEITFPKVLVTRELGVRCVGENESQTHRIYHVQEPFPIPAGAQPVILPILEFRAERGPSAAAAPEQDAEVTVKAPGMKGSRTDRKRIRDLMPS